METVAAVDLCQEWGARNLCVVGIEDLLKARRATHLLMSKACRGRVK